MVVLIRPSPQEVVVEVLQQDYYSIREAESFRFKYCTDRIVDPQNVQVLGYNL